MYIDTLHREHIRDILLPSHSFCIATASLIQSVLYRRFHCTHGWVIIKWPTSVHVYKTVCVCLYMHMHICTQSECVCTCAVLQVLK